MTVRELKEACEHGKYDRHVWGFGPDDGCDGGKLVRLELALPRYSAWDYTKNQVIPTWYELDDDEGQEGKMPENVDGH